MTLGCDPHAVPTVRETVALLRAACWRDDLQDRLTVVDEYFVPHDVRGDDVLDAAR